MKRALATLAACVLTFFVARLTVGFEAPAATPTHVLERTAQPVVVSSGTNGITADEVRRILREERANEASRERESPLAEAVTPAPSNGPQALALVDAAIAKHRWTDRDRDELRRMLGTLSGDEVDSVLGKLTLAINAGTLAVESMPL